MRTLTFIAILTFATIDAVADDLAPHQQLIDACYHLNQYRVVKLLREGVDVNATFGVSQQPLHYGKEWTPLLALVKSPREREAVTNATPERQTAKRIAILRVLISHDCDLDKCDSNGATALHISIRERDPEFANLLILFNPDVNTWATREYWGRESPLHSAYWSPKLTGALLSRGANAKVTDEYRLAAAKTDYYRSLLDFIKSNDRMPSDDENEKLGFDPRFDDIMTPCERVMNRLSAELKAHEKP